MHSVVFSLRFDDAAIVDEDVVVVWLDLLECVVFRGVEQDSLGGVLSLRFDDVASSVALSSWSLLVTMRVNSSNSASVEMTQIMKACF